MAFVVPDCPYAEDLPAWLLSDLFDGLCIVPCLDDVSPFPGGTSFISLASGELPYDALLEFPSPKRCFLTNSVDSSCILLPFGSTIGRDTPSDFDLLASLCRRVEGSKKAPFRHDLGEELLLDSSSEAIV